MRTWNPKRYYIFRSNPTEKLQNLLLIAIPRFHFALCVYTTPRAPLHHSEPKRWVAAQQTISEFGVFCVYVCVYTRKISKRYGSGWGGRQTREGIRVESKNPYKWGCFLCARKSECAFDTNAVRSRSNFMYLLDIFTMCVTLPLTTNHNLEQKNTLKAL